MLSSQEDIAANPTESNDIEMSFGVMNIILGYEDEGAIRVSKNAPLVSTLFNAIRPRKLKKLKALFWTLAIFPNRAEQIIINIYHTLSASIRY